MLGVVFSLEPLVWSHKRLAVGVRLKLTEAFNKR